MRPFAPQQPLPAHTLNALQEFIGTAAPGFVVRIKPGDATVLEVPAGAGNEQVSIGIEGRWRYITATVERASPGGAARTLDVFVTGTANVAVPGGSGEVDETVYAFALAVVEEGATPSSVAHSRLVAKARWNGTQFAWVDNLVGAASGTARHAATHGPTGTDPLTPAAIGAERAVAEVTELPPSPADGQTVDLVVDTVGTYGGPYLWRMKYRAATSGAYKWHPVGALSGLRIFDPAGAAGTLTNGVVGELTGTPNLNVPVAGVWEFAIGVAYGSTGGSTAQWVTGLRVGTTDDPGLAVNASTGGQVLGYWPPTSPPGGFQQAITQYRDDIRYTITPAGTNVRMRHYVVNGTPGISNRLLVARPVRLG